jgi:hypothetical protein
MSEKSPPIFKDEGTFKGKITEDPKPDPTEPTPTEKIEPPKEPPAEEPPTETSPPPTETSLLEDFASWLKKRREGSQ